MLPWRMIKVLCPGLTVFFSPPQSLLDVKHIHLASQFSWTAAPRLQQMVWSTAWTPQTRTLLLGAMVSETVIRLNFLKSFLRLSVH